MALTSSNKSWNFLSYLWAVNWSSSLLIVLGLPGCLLRCLFRLNEVKSSTCFVNCTRKFRSASPALRRWFVWFSLGVPSALSSSDWTAVCLPLSGSGDQIQRLLSYQSQWKLYTAQFVSAVSNLSGYCIFAVNFCELYYPLYSRMPLHYLIFNNVK